MADTRFSTSVRPPTAAGSAEIDRQTVLLSPVKFTVRQIGSMPKTARKNRLAFKKSRTIFNTSQLYSLAATVSPRAYNTTLRKEIESETIRRIVAATVELHARKGALATTHADIAEHAGVSVATVYKHFPSREALLPHCTGMVAQQAPQIDPQAILAAKTGKERISRLVRAVYQQYRYFHPWMRWTSRDAHSLPFLARRAEENRHKTEALARAALDNAAGLPVTDEAFALAMAILDYPAWQRLDNLLSDPERVNQVAEQALQLLMSKLPHQQSRK